MQSIIAETMAFSESVTYNGNLYDSYFTGFGNTEDGLFAAIVARQADNGAILQSTNLYVYCSNNPVKFVDPWGLSIKMSIGDYELFQNYCGDIFGYDVEFEYTIDNKGKNVTITGVVNYAEEGGSLTGKSLITFLINHEEKVKFKFDDNNESGCSNVSLHVSIRQAKEYGDGYLKKNGISLEDGSEQYEEFINREVESHIIHELAHVYTHIQKYDQKLRTSIDYVITDTNTTDKHSKVVNKYNEATAITVEQEFRKELQHVNRNEIVDTRLEMNGYGYWPWCSRNSNCELYGISFAGPMVSLIQGPFIYYDIIRNNSAQIEAKRVAESQNKGEN